MLGGIVLKWHSSVPFVRPFEGEMPYSIFVLSLVVLLFLSINRKEYMDPRSVMISFGSPCNRNISLMKSSENCRASISLVHDRK